MRFVDEARIKVRAGDGGPGIVAWRREKFVPLGGPSGGNGGKGGDVIFVAKEGMNSLLDLKQLALLQAENGYRGQSKNKIGSHGAHKIVFVPVGTQIRESSEEGLSWDLTEHNQKVVICKGGDGGFGNAHFKSNFDSAPERSTAGFKGEERDLVLTLKLMADVGLLGFPNAGKSTLLCRLSNARPKVADYPFTTIKPMVGVTEVDLGCSMVIADIPGLIEGASLGMGLGFRFLRHLERVRILCHMLDASDELCLINRYETINRELKNYSDDLAALPQIIVKNANIEQKQRYLPKLCSGEWIGAMAMSEPEVGTDVLGMKTSAKKISGGYVINGQKMWITNGAIDDKKSPADVLFLYAKSEDQSTKRNISSFIIEGKTKGFSVGQKLQDKLGMRASITAELVFDDCHVSDSQLVGHEGDAILHMMRNLEIERLTLAAMGLGIMRRSLVIMNDYANQRSAFGTPIINFGQIQKHIAESYAKYKACRAYIYQVAYAADTDIPHSRIDSDAVKLIASTAAKEVADSAIQVLGGYGYMGEYVVERLWRDAKLLEIGGGTIEAHQKNIAEDLKKHKQAIY